MAKNLFVFALLALITVAATASRSNKLANKKWDFIRKARAQLNSRFGRRDDTCTVITCAKEGEECVSQNSVCQYMTDCNGGTCSRPTVGESCEYGSFCADSHCNATESSPGICLSIPGTPGAKCDADTGCDKYAAMHCDSETSKCIKLPKQGEDCYLSPSGQYHAPMCHPEFYCDMDNGIKCFDRKNTGDECTNSDHCKEGNECFLPHGASTGKCTKENPEEGEYCNDRLECVEGYECSEDNKCVKKETCYDASDCNNNNK